MRVSLVCCWAVLLAATLTSVSFAQEDLNLERVVMFSSGVAFYEHRGAVQDNTTVDLKFNVDDINDLLKSMVLQDAGGGQISTITYNSREPITRTLNTFAIDLTDDPSLADLLRQVRGEEIAVAAPNPVQGTIVGLETRKVSEGENVLEKEFITLLTAEGLQSLAVEKLEKIQLLDKKLNDELRQALKILAMGHSTEKKTVTLNFLGQGKRPVRVGYIQEAPIWKTSYRLVLNEDEKPFLQGWAIVENTTEMDWKDVELTLISGRPISFRMDLYSPLFVTRPLVEPELYASLRPQTYDQDMKAADREFAALKRQAEQLARGKRQQNQNGVPGGAGFFGGGFGGGGMGGTFGAVEEEVEMEELDLSEGVQSIAQAGDVGELFQYVIENPVSLPRRQSAMLPIVNDSVEGEKLSIYNATVQAKHPLNGLRLKNTTGLNLMQGPVTVFDSSVYAGDARIMDLTPGTSRLISYALDLDTEVSPELKAKPDELTKVWVVRGEMHVSRKHERSTKYLVKNSGSKAKTVLIEHNKDSNWKLLRPETPAETTRDLYRFEVEAAPGEPEELTVVEESTNTEIYYLTDLTEDQIRFYTKASVVSDEIKAAFHEVVDRQAEIAKLGTRIRQSRDEIKSISEEQTRIRENMARIPQSGELYARYIKKFGSQEDRIEELRKQISSWETQQRELEDALEEYLTELTLK